ncbi:MAG TPA: heavy metal-associated domain-containing protein [Acidimicrobiales bacterium]
MTSPENQAPVGQAGVTTVHLSIEGMHCGSCSALIEETLIEQPGVLEASVDLDAARAVVRFDRDRLGSNDLCGLVSGVGYEATVLETT